MSSLDCFRYVMIKTDFSIAFPSLSIFLNITGCQHISRESKANMTIVTHVSASPDWMTRHSPHRVWIRDIRLYIFCKKYKRSHQTRKGGEFEIRFLEEDGTLLFCFLILLTNYNGFERDIGANLGIAADAFEELFRDEPLSITDGPVDEVVG